MSAEPAERIPKLECARRQLRTAIELFFRTGDTVSIHTLTAAAHEVLYNLKDASGTSHFSLKDVERYAPPERRKEIHQKISEAENFFKHATRDSDKTLEFRPVQTMYLLLDAVLMYPTLRGAHFYAGTIFLTWFFAKYPELLKIDAIPESQRAVLTRLPPPDQVYREDFLPFMEKPPPNGMDA